MQTLQLSMFLTRPKGQNEAFLVDIDPDIRARLQVVFTPLIEIVPTGATVDLRLVDAVIFTSVSGVLHAPRGDGRPAYCVGQTTTQAATKAGWLAKVAGQNADELIKHMITDPPAARLVHLSGVHTRGNIAETLCANGITAANQSVYDQRLMDLSPEAAQVLLRGNHVVVPLFSPRTAAQLASHELGRSKIDIIALSAAVAEPLAHVAINQLTIAETPDRRSMVRAVEKLVQDTALG